MQLEQLMSQKQEWKIKKMNEPKTVEKDSEYVQVFPLPVILRYKFKIGEVVRVKATGQTFTVTKRFPIWYMPSPLFYGYYTIGKKIRAWNETEIESENIIFSNRIIDEFEVTTKIHSSCGS